MTNADRIRQMSDEELADLQREKDARFSENREVSVTWNDAIYHIKAAPTIVPENVCAETERQEHQKNVGGN